jgi:hypothetical protein
MLSLVSAQTDGTSEREIPEGAEFQLKGLDLSFKMQENKMEGINSPHFIISFY